MSDHTVYGFILLFLIVWSIWLLVMFYRLERQDWYASAYIMADIYVIIIIGLLAFFGGFVIYDMLWGWP